MRDGATGDRVQVDFDNVEESLEKIKELVKEMEQVT